MKVSLNWLKDYIDINYDPEKIADILSDLGFPCEGIETIEDDIVIDVEVTSNRGDCLGMIGVARELAAATGAQLKLPTVKLSESANDVSKLAFVQIDEPKLCKRYTARVIEGIKVGPSPQWMRDRLEAVGIRSVNNVVDATNYAMWETGQPPHAFDYDKIKDGQIIIRKAKRGELLVTIDGSKCELDENTLVISDPSGAVAVAGVMGGLETEVSDTTTNILLEEAFFDPVTVRHASRKFGLFSESAHRFERIVDMENIEWASRRTAQLIIEVAGGTLAKGIVDEYPSKAESEQVRLRMNRLAKLIGIKVETAEAEKILSRLGFQTQIQNDEIICTVPSWRSDVYREADLIEEVIRVYGYDKIPTEKQLKIEVVGRDHYQKTAQQVGSALNCCGYYETVNVTFTEQGGAKLFAKTDVENHLSVKDEARKNANLLRQSLLSSLMAVIKTNYNFDNSNVNIYELANVFISHEAGRLPIEKTMLAIAGDGDFRDLRGAVEQVVSALDKSSIVEFKPAKLKWASTGAEILIDGQVYGTAGIVNDEVRKYYGFKEVKPIAAELNFNMLAALETEDIKIKPIPRFPAVERDISVIVDEQIQWGRLESVLRKNAPAVLENVRFVEIYRGKGIPADQKSITFSMIFRDEDGTLTHQQVDVFEKEIVNALQDQLKAKLRSA